MIACIRIPHFATTAAQLVHPEWTQKPLILAQYKGRRGSVYAACETALKSEVKPGMSLSRARAMCPEAAIEMASPTQVRRTVDNLLHILSDYSQWIEAKHRVQTAMIYVDIGKLMPKEGEALAQQMIDRLQMEGFKPAIGLASNKFTAAVAAATIVSGQIVLVKKGMEGAFLAPLPTAYLPLDTETARRLDLLGLRRMGQVVMLPRSVMLEQFGKPGGQLHKLASGEDQRRVSKYLPPLGKSASHQFDPPLADRLILESVLASLVSEVSDRLLSEGMACSQLSLILRFENHSEQDVEKLLREPLSRSGQLYRMIQPLLDKFHIPCGITEIALRVGKIEPIQPKQLSLFDAPQAEALEGALIRLSDMYGDECFYRVETHHHPSGLPELQFNLLAVAAA